MQLSLFPETGWAYYEGRLYPRTHQIALEEGFTRYYLGKECPHGHNGLRRVKDQYCCECKKAGRREWKKSEAGKLSEKRRQRNAQVLGFIEGDVTGTRRTCSQSG